MKGRLGGLRTLIQNENSSAYYVHCFAHQLQLALVACASSHPGVSNFIGKVNLLVNYIRSSNKRQELLRGKQAKHYKDLITRMLYLQLQELNARFDENKRRQSSSVSNLHHYKNDCLFNILDLQLQELNARFDEANTELLQCVGCLSPTSSFTHFDVDKLVRMVELYPKDFEGEPEVVIRNQLQNSIKVVRCDPDFKELRGLSDLSVQLVKTNKCNTFSVVYKLVKLALLLPVATTSVERVFSAMNHVKSDKSSTMGDQWLNDRLVTYLERDVLSTISNDVILAHFQEFHRRFSL